MTRTIALLIFPEFQILDAAGPLAAFEIAARMAPGAYDLKLIAAEAGPVRATCGVEMLARALPAPDKIDTLIISGGEGTREVMLRARIQRFVRICVRESRRVASVCSGAYVLAEAGVLDGKPATTHWTLSEHFARRYPRVRLESDRIYTQAGKVWTSAGISAGVDLSLALIADDLGEDVARRVAQMLVVYRRRPAGQSQFSALLDIEKPEGRFSALLAQVRENLRARWDVERMAAQCGMSARQFARAFAAETGVTPAKAVEKLRVEAARTMLESGATRIEDVAIKCGFGDAERLRRSFARLLKATPSAMKRRAR